MWVKFTFCNKPFLWKLLVSVSFFNIARSSPIVFARGNWWILSHQNDFLEAEITRKFASIFQRLFLRRLCLNIRHFGWSRDFQNSVNTDTWVTTNIAHITDKTMVTSGIRKGPSLTTYLKTYQTIFKRGLILRSHQNFFKSVLWTILFSFCICQRVSLY